MNVWIRRAAKFLRRPRLSSLSFWVTRLILRPKSWSFHVVCQNPLVIITLNDMLTLDLLAHIKNRKALILCLWWWTAEVEDTIKIGKQISDLAEANPNHKVVHLANSIKEKQCMDANGLSSLYCNQNCFLDENIFQILEDEPKRFRALYDARPSAFKRHELAVDVENLALISYLSDADTNERAKYVHQFLPNAKWLNGLFSDHPMPLSPDEVCRYINQSQTGLMLSEIEGANYASAQYLLCGIPVVTTESKGGRDTLFHPDYVITANAESAAIERAVQELIERKVNPHEVRQRTLEIMRQHRGYFLKYVCDYIRENNGEITEEDLWHQAFVNKMIRHGVSPREIRKL